MADLDISIEVVCAVCGRTLNENGVDDKYGFYTLKVEPCETCLEKAEAKSDA